MKKKHRTAAGMVDRVFRLGPKQPGNVGYMTGFFLPESETTKEARDKAERFVEEFEKRG